MAPEHSPADRSFDLPGLAERAEILVDHWGVAHIYASSLGDLFLAQGFNAARERLWQLDFWRRRGLGLLSEALGAEYIELDRAARLFLYRGAMKEEWPSYGPDAERIVTAFTDGINAYVRLARTLPDLLPIEFRTLGYEPQVWLPEDVTRIRAHALFFNAEQEATRARVLRDFGPAVEDLRRQREPPRPVSVPAGLDLADIPADVLRVYDLATTWPLLAVPGAQDATQAGRARRRPEGSNNWAVAGDNTATGRPILANDPHRALTVPSLRYIAHLSAPGLDVIGAGEPALPGIAMGHNGHVAWGVTSLPADQEDLYVYQTHPQDSRLYRYGEGWEPMQAVTESIPVKGRAPVAVELRYTRHGPVVCEDAARQVAVSVRAAWLQAGAAPYLGSLSAMRATDRDQFISAMSRWHAPAMNVVYADRAGNIAWQAVGLIPVRRGWDGLLPVPGDGRYEWAGFYGTDQLPASANPVRGWLASANEMNLPSDYPADRLLGFDWFAPYRLQRIEETIRGHGPMSLLDAVSLQADYTSIPAREIVAAVRGCSSREPKVAEALSLLRHWDARLLPDSAAAALFEVWYRRHLRPALLARALAPHVQPGRLAEALSLVMPEESLAADARVDLALLSDLSWLGPAPADVLADIVTATLRDAITELDGRLGEDWSQWAWGKLHTVRFTHEMSGLVADAVAWRLNVGTAPRGGSGDTVGNTTYAADFTQVAGSTWRMVIDVGGWDNSLAMNAPGQSGDPDNAHYGDLFGPWSQDSAFPLLYTRERVKAAAEHRIILNASSR